mgnify:CR=1 FL=1
MLNTYRHEDPSVKAGAARTKTFQAVDGGQAAFGIVEGEKLPVHAAPVARCGALLGRLGIWGRLFGKARLCGHVGQSVRGAMGEDIPVRDLKDGNA